MKHKALLIPHNMYKSFCLLSAEDCGKLFMAIFDYDLNGNITEFDDLALKILLFQFINILDYNREHYEEICRKRSDVAKKRWESLKKEETGEEQTAP